MEVVGLARTMGQIVKQSSFSSIDVVDRHLAWHCAREIMGGSRVSTVWERSWLGKQVRDSKALMMIDMAMLLCFKLN